MEKLREMNCGKQESLLPLLVQYLFNNKQCVYAGIVLGQCPCTTSILIVKNQHPFNLFGYLSMTDIQRMYICMSQWPLEISKLGIRRLSKSVMTSSLSGSGLTEQRAQREALLENTMSHREARDRQHRQSGLSWVCQIPEEETGLTLSWYSQISLCRSNCCHSFRSYYDYLELTGLSLTVERCCWSALFCRLVNLDFFWWVEGSRTDLVTPSFLFFSA